MRIDYEKLLLVGTSFFGMYYLVHNGYYGIAAGAFTGLLFVVLADIFAILGKLDRMQAQSSLSDIKL